MKKKKILIFTSMMLLFALAITACWQGIVVRNYTIESDKITDSVRVVQISDLHSSRYGRGQRNLIRKIRNAEPDVILLTGDIADDLVPHDATIELLSKIAVEYPCFYVSGNHEAWCGDPEEVFAMIEECGVTVLHGEGVRMEVNGTELGIFGVDDPDVFGGYHDDAAEAWVEQLEVCAASKDEGMFNILLSHRPELVEHYKEAAFDLVLSGHAHGGQVRLPFINGLWAPNQGLFPQYAGGQYALSQSTTMIVSRGLAKSRIPRVFNPPELVVIELAVSA